MVQEGEIMGIEILDHIIVGAERLLSFEGSQSLLRPGTMFTNLPQVM
ncbi:MAG: hypothetical protein CME25_23035 [Gemmatimonadetes bacterium]|nr:hypothetical protein [Gemmatimonadota bacterium]|tara:strand:- start:4 stop:144 length:141 start_codon:yes stop_codon:yes gene_type:complete